MCLSPVFLIMGDLKIRTFGRFQIVDCDGNDRTPRSRKACAIIAILLDSPDLCRSRARLQDMLWSDRSAEQAAASLRQDLSEIRRTLGRHRSVLLSDTRSVGLKPEAVSSDLTDPMARAQAAADGRVFLEDVDVRDPEFEDWLRDRRVALEDQVPPPSPVRRSAGQVSAVPVLVLSCEAGGALARHIGLSILQGVASMGAIRLHEGGFDATGPGDAPVFRLLAEEHALGHGAIMRLRMQDISDGRICWDMNQALGTDESADLGMQIDRLINIGVDRTIEELAGSGPSLMDDRRDDVFFRPMQQMFATLAKDREMLRSRMSDAYSLEGRGIYLAWQAYMVVYDYGEFRHDGIDDLKEEARELIRRALEIEPHNPTVLAIASHIYSFVFRQPDVAHELAERSLRISESTPLGWLFLGSAKFYRGDLEAGTRCITRARDIAGHGPYRPLIDFFSGMASMVTGQFDQGIATLRLAHELQPEFLPPLRYLLVGYLKTEQIEQAAELVQRLKRLESGFDLSQLSSEEYPVRKIGEINPKMLPKSL